MSYDTYKEKMIKRIQAAVVAAATRVIEENELDLALVYDYSTRDLFGKERLQISLVFEKTMSKSARTYEQK